MLSNIRIVLIGTSHPGNIGAVARAMKNMCLSSLYLVQPKTFPSAEATARASGADDVLARAHICQSLEEALQDCCLVIGTSARSRTLSWPVLDARTCAARVRDESRTHPVAIVFGREHSGMSNEELELCHAQVKISGNPDYMSLNIAAAVQIIAYEILMAESTNAEAGGVTGAVSDVVGSGSEEAALASANEMALFYRHLEEVMVQTGFLNPQRPKFLMRRLRRLYNRARPDMNEINILRGILTAVQKYRV
jgi:tRNA (cytidine32/uridine32-2'-O)-methyltransferase